MDNYNDLVEELIESKKILKQLDQEISKLKLKGNFEKNNIRNYYKISQQLRKENQKLLKEHKSNLLDIQQYNSQLGELQKKFKSQNSEMQTLIKENEQLKQKMKRNAEINSPRKKIRGVSDLRKSFGFHLKEVVKIYEKKSEEKIDEENEEGENENPGLDKEKKRAEFEKLKELKVQSEATFEKLQERISSYYKETDLQQTFIINYKNYIESINNQIGSFRQQLRISVVGEANFNFGENGVRANQLIKDMEATSTIINQVNDNIYTLKNRTLKKGENMLRNIKTKLVEINNRKNLTYFFLSNRMDSITNDIEDLKRLCQSLQRSLSDIMTQKKQIDKNIINLKANIEKFMNNYKEGKKKINDAIRKTIRKTGKNIFNSINKSLRQEEKNENEKESEEMFDNIAEEEGEDMDEDLMRGSTLIGINDFGKNIDLFKSIVLFNNKNEREENRMRESKILRKNWNEVCYVYDDYDMHDANFEIKAVGLGAFSFFNSCSIGFYMGRDIEILNFEINGQKSRFTYNDYCLDFNIILKNLQSAKIHLKYRERPNFNTMPPNEKERYRFFRQEYYGLSESLAGQMGKFRLILKGSFEIVSFKDDFLIRNENNKREKEYVWGGKIPSGGKRTLVKLSKNEATWSINCNTQIVSRRGNLRNTVLNVPMGFVGGNNDIIKMDYSSPQTKNILVDEEKRIYEIKYKNTGYSQGDFILTGQIKNRCKGDWDVDLTDEIIEKNIPVEDKRDKNILEKIARKIIQDYDRENKDNILNFMDYAKIGKWVNKNIRYEINYSGRTEMTAMDIYNKGVGVCHHMTRLSNALLYSLGYKVIYTNGFACESRAEFDQNCAHAWSLIEVKGKWYPFDATWGILSGKLPVCHVFQGFFGKSITLVGTDAAVFGRNNSETGKFIK